MPPACPTALNEMPASRPPRPLLTGNGVMRHPDGFAVFQLLEGRLTMQANEGRPSGSAANGRGRHQSASGPTAGLAGRSFTWRATATGPAACTIETVFD